MLTVLKTPEQPEQTSTTDVAVDPDVRVIEIEPSRGWAALDLQGVWSTENLCGFSSGEI